MALFAMLITWYGSFLIIFIITFLISRKIAKFMVFPAHCSFFKRSVEYRAGVRMATQVIGQVLEQRYSLDIMTYSVINFEKIAELVEVNNNTYHMIKSVEYTLTRQRELGTITEDQENLQEKLDILQDSFKSVIIILGEERKNLWELGEIFDARIEMFQNNSFEFESKDIVKRCVRTCTDF